MPPRRARSTDKKPHKKAPTRSSRVLYVVSFLVAVYALAATISYHPITDELRRHGIREAPLVPEPYNSFARWVFLVPLMTVTYLPIALPDLLLDAVGAAEARASYLGLAGRLMGMEIGTNISTAEAADLAALYPSEYAAGQRLPTHMRGIYWMDGNGGGTGFSDFACLHAGSWATSSKSTLEFPLYAAYSFSHFPSSLGDVLRAFVWRWTYVFHFNEELKEADITLRVFGVDLPTGAMGAFRMALADDGSTWNRQTWLGKPDGPPHHTYFLRKVVREDGSVDDDVMSQYKQAFTREKLRSSPLQLIRTK